MLLCLSNIGDVMATSFRFLYWRVCCYVCTRSSRPGRSRSRQRSFYAQRRISHRSQTHSFRRSAKFMQRSAHQGLPHAHSDPELRSMGRRELDPTRHDLRDSRRAHPHYMDDVPYMHAHSHRQAPYYRASNTHYGCNCHEPTRHSHRSHQHHDHFDYEVPPTRHSTRSERVSRAMSRDEEHMQRASRLPHARGRSMPNSTRARTKNAVMEPSHYPDPYREVDQNVVSKTPIITNRYAVDECVASSERIKSNMRSQSMPRSIHNQNRSAQSYHDIELPRSSRRRRAMSTMPRQSSVPQKQCHGRYLELSELQVPNIVLPANECVRCGHEEQPYDYHYGHGQYPYQRSQRQRRSARHERPEKLPPSPRIMSPMGFAVKRQTRQRASYDYDEDSLNGWPDYYGDISEKNRPVPIWLCVFLVISYILGGAVLFAYWEQWSFLDSAYFCFITLTTIGFGDFVPAKGVKDESEQSIAYCSLYLLFGIALLAMSFNLVQEEFIANVKEVARRLGILKEDEEDNGD